MLTKNEAFAVAEFIDMNIFSNELREENEKLKEELKKARFAVEHNNNLVQEERLRRELYRKDGEIQGLRFAIRCITDRLMRMRLKKL